MSFKITTYFNNYNPYKAFKKINFIFQIELNYKKRGSISNVKYLKKYLNYFKFEIKEMWLTKNEKRVLKLLLDNARISDTHIAEKLNISSQAVGRIRRNLEEEIVDKYNLDLNFSKIGLNVFIICKAKLTQSGEKFGKLNVEKKLIDEPNIILLCKLLSEEFPYFFIARFKNIQDLSDFFSNGRELHKYVKFGEMSPLDTKNILKQDSKQLIIKTIENLGTKSTKIDID